MKEWIHGKGNEWKMEHPIIAFGSKERKEGDIISKKW